MSDVRIKAPVIIREIVSDSLYRAALPNGKPIHAFARPADRIPALSIGQHYHVLLSLCDFDEGRLVPEDMSGITVKHQVLEGCAATQGQP